MIDIQSLNNKCFECRVHTSDNWSPTAADGTVELSISKLRGASQEGDYRVAVWGEDDVGMDRDYSPDDVSEAIKMFETIKSMDDVTMISLDKLGFDFF